MKKYGKYRILLLLVITYYEKSKILAQEKSDKSKTLAGSELGLLWSETSIVTSTSYCRRLLHTNLGLYTHSDISWI